MMQGLRTDKIWGHEEVLIDTPEYSAKLLFVNKGYISSIHYHKYKDETFYVLEGTLEIRLEDRVVCMSKGDIYRLTPNTQHSFWATTPVCKILEISYCPVENDNYRLTKSHKIEEETDG